MGAVDQRRALERLSQSMHKLTSGARATPAPPPPPAGQPPAETPPQSPTAPEKPA